MTETVDVDLHKTSQHPNSPGYLYNFTTDNWDGEGARAIEEDLILKVQGLMRMLPADLPEPLVSPHPDGSVGIVYESQSGENILHFDINTDGVVCFYYNTGWISKEACTTLPMSWEHLRTEMGAALDRMTTEQKG